ncbi:hypothetical protein R3W88_016496 [Solanum pinnatisectum]|uniref:Secreted protein n=1 Tax=Solanum pinnatisectum TaxID=50273 RepID=A0AAV9KYA8_9SOLN|nr:hypothetical protein R3W88_016496 [Solanum pinnatisectum]
MFPLAGVSPSRSSATAVGCFCRWLLLVFSPVACLKKRREERGEQREAATDFHGGLPAPRRALLLHWRRGEWGDAGVSPVLAAAAGRFNELLAGAVVVIRRYWVEQLLMLFSHRAAAVVAVTELANRSWRRRRGIRHRRLWSSPATGLMVASTGWRKYLRERAVDLERGRGRGRERVNE